jgi:tetratricopeptide (TPR) repeat protein
MLDNKDPGSPADVAARRSRLRRRLLIGVGIVAAVGVGVGSAIGVAKLGITVAKQSASACIDAIYKSGEGEPADCRQRRVIFWLARTLPWTRDVARQEAADIESMVLEYQLDMAVLRDFDVASRDQAARELVELYRGEYVPDRVLTTAFGKLDEVGARELMVEMVSEQDSSHARKRAMRAALELGDWEAAGRIARMSAADDYDVAQDAAIVACILGERETAAARMREADLGWREFKNEPLPDLLLIEVHCELPRTQELLDSFKRSAVQRLDDLYSPDAEIDVAYNRHEQGIQVARMALEAEPIAWGEDLGRHKVEFLHRMSESTTLELAPPLVRTREERPIADSPVIVTELEAGARRLAELFAAAPSEQTFEDYGNTVRPRESLAWGGFCLATMAAAERVWRGQLDEAREIYAVARELAATEDFRPFSPAGELPVLGLYAVLDPESALRVVRAVPDEQLAATPADVQVLLRVQFALVHEQAGEIDRAIELLAGAVELLPKLPAGDFMTPKLDAGARWVYGAMLFRTGRESSFSTQQPEDLRGRVPSASEAFAFWWTAAMADPTQQYQLRWQAGGESMLWMGLPSWALSSGLELLARGAPAEHRELWLDMAAADIHQNPLETIRTRASAAERLGDAAAVERWRAREAALVERLQDDRAAALWRMLD